MQNIGNLGYGQEITEPETITHRGHLAKSLLSQMKKVKPYEVLWSSESYRSCQRHSWAETKAMDPPHMFFPPKLPAPVSFDTT